MAYTTIDKPTDYFNTVLYTGDASSPRTISGVGFSPDWVWCKNRTTANDNRLVDQVRGANKELSSNRTLAEYSDNSDGNLTAFTSDGFTITQGSANINNWNKNTDSYVVWNWLAGGTASSNTDGSITSSVSASTTAGISIVSYTGNATNGATVGHGLGAVPDMLIGKDLSDGSGWGIWHKNLSGATYRLAFTTDAQSNDSFLFGGSGNTLPTSTVFTLGSGGGLNGSNANIVYAFTSIKGYSKFGSYTGNGNNDGTFVYTGFKPAFLMVKKSSASGSDWNLHHNKSPGFNVNDNYLAPNSSAAEVTNNSFQIFDLLSNGFKCRGTGTGTNASGETHIYMAFAENPFVTSGGIPTTAR